jgi:zinc transporter 11
VALLIICAFIHRNLAIGIGIQNFPEGLAVSLPLVGSGLSPLKSFW